MRKFHLMCALSALLGVAIGICWSLLLESRELPCRLITASCEDASSIVMYYAPRRSKAVEDELCSQR